MKMEGWMRCCPGVLLQEANNGRRIINELGCKMKGSG